MRSDEENRVCRWMGGGGAEGTSAVLMHGNSVVRLEGLGG